MHERVLEKSGLEKDREYFVQQSFTTTEGNRVLPDVVIHLPDNKKIFPQEYFKGRPGIVRVTVHKAINPNKLTKKSIENLNTSVYNIIFEQLKNYEQ